MERRDLRGWWAAKRTPTPSSGISGSGLAQSAVFVVPSSEIRQHPTHYTLMLVIISGVLMAVGLANLYSASPDHRFFYSQARHAGIGMIIMLLLGFLVPPRRLSGLAHPTFLIVVAMLIVVLLVGRIGGGAQRWIAIGPLQGQPSEFAKLALAMSVARYLAVSEARVEYGIRDLWPLLLAVGGVFTLIFLQPDLGTAGVCVMIASAQIAFLPLRRRLVASVTGLGLVGSVVAWMFFLHDYQKKRVLTLFNPSADPTGSGYNSLQSLVAVGSGQLTGKGFLAGSQTQLQFLPARHTDFIFSVFAEEQGFWACLAVLVLFALLVHVALEIGRSAKNTFSSLLAIGAAAMIFVQAVVNFAMVLGMFPVVGMPLPFFSHGGSFLVTLGATLGCLIAVDRENCGKEVLRRRRATVVVGHDAVSMT